MTPVEVRSQLVETLELDLVGPAIRDSLALGDPGERLPQAPSRWYLTGFLVPAEAGADQAFDPSSDDELDATPRRADLDENTGRDTAAAAQQRRLPTCMGVSVLVPAEAKHLTVDVRWGDYVLEDGSTDVWKRLTRAATVTLAVDKELEVPKEEVLKGSKGLTVALLVRPVGASWKDAGIPDGVRTVSVFLVNRRPPAPDARRDEAFAFQTELELRPDAPFVARPNLRGLFSEEWDDRVADLQYRNDGEYAVGHNVATEACLETDSAGCRRVRTRWVPRAEVERVAPPKAIPGVVLGMDALGALQDGGAALAALSPLVAEYRAWIEGQEAQVPAGPAKRRETGLQLIQEMRATADRIERGIALLAGEDAQCLDAFRLANQAMAMAARRRLGVMQGKAEESVVPTWYPFQLAFLLMNLPGIANPESEDRELVDLLFFPTGGGKTEAYLGLAAFTLTLRRLRNPGISGAGVSVLMRYTLRLLTLDQLSRAATLICALELLRERHERLGEWPFEIGLWVGRAATPNQMGSKERDFETSARRRTRDFKNDDRKPSPIPLEECPWCGTKFSQNSFDLYANGKPNSDYPTDLLIRCVNKACVFTRDRKLPVVAVDDPLYRRLPCFVIATVDKFAALPWTGPVGGLFGRVQRHDKQGFYGPCQGAQGSALLPGGRLLPPDLIIQDELHLISGPLGTMAGLYESAIEELCLTAGGGIRPKIVASTATVRRAEAQIRALFNRSRVDVFPPQGPDRRDSFFARTLAVTEANARLYVGVSAQGRSPKVAMLRVYLSLLCSAQKWYEAAKKKKDPENAADAYMTVLGYFNALRELGGARRLIEDEIRTRALDRGARKRVGEAAGLFVNRKIDYEPVELTSRVNTAQVSGAKQRLALAFSEDKRVDVAIATNMISVGLDITRLGLMVVFGQPKTTAEYIQATSRVGRDANRPGLVVTILNIHKPRDRSHYERFTGWHETFYRGVEATSVTPFSPRALDKGLAAAMVGLARQGWESMTPPRGANEVLARRSDLDSLLEVFGDRAGEHDALLSTGEAAALRERVRRRVADLLDAWSGVVQENQKVGVSLEYNAAEGGAPVALLRDFLDLEAKGLPPLHWKRKFRAGRSLRDVEPSVNIWVRTMGDNVDVLQEDQA